MKVATTSLLFFLTGCITDVEGEKASKHISRKLTKVKNGKSDKSSKSSKSSKSCSDLIDCVIEPIVDKIVETIIKPIVDKIGGCMSGDLLIKQPGDVPIALKDLSPGDTVLGLDESFTEATCQIITVGQWGEGLLFDPYTADQLIYDAEDFNLQQHGEVGVQTTESMFIPISTCPLILDDEGIAFTSLDGYALGDANTGPFSLGDYVGMWKLQSAFVRIAPEIMSASAYNFTRVDASESLGFYSTIQEALACTTDTTACIDAFAALQANVLRYNDDVVAKLSPFFFQGVDATNGTSIQEALNTILSN